MTKKEDTFSIIDWDAHHRINNTDEKTSAEIRKLLAEEKLRVTDEKTYNIVESVVFRRLRDAFGGLSNRAPGFPLIVNGTPIPTSEALFQALKYPGNPDLQKLIIEQKSPMDALRIGNAYGNEYFHSRKDLNNVRKTIMYWCLRVKLAEHFTSFGLLLESTGKLPIVDCNPENDRFWGAVRDVESENILVGGNILGLLLMQLRQAYYEKKTDLQYVDLPDISEFMLFSEAVRPIDARENRLT